MNPLALLSEKPSVEVNANIGENVKQEKSTLKLEQGKTEQTADEISNDTKYEADVINQITENVPIEYLLIMVLLAGWAVPAPKECYNSAKWLVVDVFQTIVVVPIKGVANFTLLLLGRNKL